LILPKCVLICLGSWHGVSIGQPGIERVQALADISRSALCYRSNETRAPLQIRPIVHN